MEIPSFVRFFGNNSGHADDRLWHLEELRLSRDNIVQLYETDRHHFLEIRFSKVPIRSSVVAIK